MTESSSSIFPLLYSFVYLFYILWCRALFRAVTLFYVMYISSIGWAYFPRTNLGLNNLGSCHSAVRRKTSRPSRRPHTGRDSLKWLREVSSFFIPSDNVYSACSTLCGVEQSFLLEIFLFFIMYISSLVWASFFKNQFTMEQPRRVSLGCLLKKHPDLVS